MGCPGPCPADNGKHHEDYLKQARFNVVQRNMQCWLMKAANRVCCTQAHECNAYLETSPPPSSRAHPSNLSHSPSLQPFPRFLASASSQLTFPPPSAFVQECYCPVLSQQNRWRPRDCLMTQIKAPAWLKLLSLLPPFFPPFLSSFLLLY